MKKIINTIGFVDDNDDIVIMGIVHEANTTNVIRLTLSEEDVTIQRLEKRTAIPEIPPDLISHILKDGVS
ncbi:MAG: hypothetical protein K5979_06995 [Ruminococcus sp.]|nr:hypothetical protein [Ruminococcus sp.]